MNNEPVAWQGLTAEEIATIPNDEFRLQKVEKILKERNTHPAKTEEFMAGDAICSSCGCKSLYKTARSEWCVTHKCLWQKDYELTLTDEEIIDIWLPFATDGIKGKIAFARAILRKAQEK